MNRLLAVASASLILSLSLAACGGGGGSSSSGGGGSQSAGFEVPTEISAVPTNLSGSVGGVTKPGLKSKLSALKQAATDPNTDYSKAVTRKYVNEHTLEQFDIIEEVLAALAQTNYADEANVNQGPYKAMVSFQDEQNGVQTKSLEPWVVDSAMIEEDGQDVNRVRVWIDEADINRLIKAEFKIYQSATRKEDGSYSDYGVWKLNVKFGDSPDSFFAADAGVDANGRSVIRINERQTESTDAPPHEMKAIMNRSETDGYGKVMFPDWESCHQPDCNPAPVVAKYAYNANHLALQKAEGAVQYKDRTSVNDMTHRYGLFDSTTGQDIMKTKSFGFPVDYTDGEGRHRFAYYGAWQGRHSLWSDGGTIPQGTTVTRQDRGPQQNAETYTVSAPFVGTLTKRTAVAANVNDVKGIPVETWVNSNFELRYLASGPDGAGWYECTHTFDPDTGFFQQNCASKFTAFDSLIVGENDNRKFVNINQCNGCDQNNPPTNYVYLADGPSGAGFYVGTFDSSTGRTTATSTLYTPSDNEFLWVNIGGSIYIMYNGTGWVEKTLTGFDTETWTPEFAPSETGDKPYTMPLDREFYINSRGANYIVKRTSTGYEVKIEIQSTANPVNASTFVPTGTVFKSSWSPDTESTFEFVTDPNSANFMKLVYKTIGQTDQSSNPAPQVGQVVTNGQWGLVAYVNGNQTTNQFNWDYPREGDMWGSQQYLKDASNNYVLLSDPVRLLPVTLTNNAGEEKSLALQYDGWMHGLPDLFHELFKNGHVMTEDISNKIINIPAGTQVTDADDQTKGYLVKPLEVSQFLAVLENDPGDLDISVADSIDLNSVPVLVDHNMGDVPETDGVKYSEGILVE
ncbi:hypothetical protein [Candidatus Manganitrophus noduliformans]|uniref:Lipoprotein n=1 Tax=Candidatus Manganitrophus noduliformans TaxID=2606439 RepID=A0A7X6DM40_9BACT|nr:hypothetical protein [Candidatus Manganitrophus noduliformans]NKE69662.1 hypothetical protein [Candidatus Manganitrophus noduliformans]